jgi:cytidine deaminase
MSGGGTIPAAEVTRRLAQTGMSIEQFLLSLIPEAKRFAIPPISNFYVGAVALGASGSVYYGANFEFLGQALSFTVHGEQAATAHALAYGETGMRMIAVSAAPCGYCRQFLNELSTASTLQVLLPNMPATPLTALLPNAFGPADLGITAAMMSPQSHGMQLQDADPLVQAALAAANASYAPYTQSYAGVALATSDGGIYAGGIAENAAFNPSMSPLEQAVVNLVIDGGKTYADIVDAVLVELRSAKASQIAATREVLASISRAPLRIVQV